MLKTNQAGSNKDRNYYINSAIGIAIMFLFGFIVQPFGPVTELGVKYLGIFIGLIWLWSFVDMTWPVFAAFTAMLALNCTDFMTILNGFSNVPVMMSLFVMLVVMPIAEASGIFNYVAVWIMGKDFIKGHPWRLTTVILLLGFIGSVINAGLVAIFMLCDLVLKIRKLAGLDGKSMWCGAMIAGVLLSCIVGMMIFPFYQSPLFVIGLFQAAQIPVEMNTVMYILGVLSFFVIELLLWLFTMRYIFRVDVTALENGDVADVFQEQLPSMSKEQKGYTFLLFAYLVLMIIVGSASILPKNIVTGFLLSLGSFGVSFIFLMIVMIWQIKGRSAITIDKAASKVVWSAIMIVWCAMVLSKTLTSEETGISLWLNQLLTPVLSGKSNLVFLILVTLVVLGLTNLLNNAVVTMLAFSFSVTMTMSMGIDVMLIIIILSITSQVALLLPGSSFYGGLYYGYAEEIGKNNCLLWGATAMITAGIAFLILIPIWLAIF